MGVGPTMWCPREAGPARTPGGSACHERTTNPTTLPDAGPAAESPAAGPARHVGVLCRTMVRVTTPDGEPEGAAAAGGAGTPVPVRRRSSRRAWGVVVPSLLAVGLVVTLGVLTVQVTHPRYDAITAADAVVVLGEPDDQALALARQLLDRGVSTQLLLLVPWGAPPLCSRPPAGVTVTCVVPDPRTTRGDARAIASVAAAHGWHSVAVVTWDTHVTRSRRLVEACFPGRVAMTGYRLDGGLGDVVHQVGGYVQALASSGC